MLGSLGGPELILIFIVGLVVFGPRKLPEIGKSIGKMMGEFKRASADFRRTVEDEVETEKLRKDLDTADYPSQTRVIAPPPAAPAPQIREAEGSVPAVGSAPAAVDVVETAATAPGEDPEAEAEAERASS